MEVLVFFIGKLMPFVTLTILIVGLLYKLVHWQRAAVGNIALFPSATGRGQLLGKVLGEVVFFSSFRKQDSSLWQRTWIFHVTLLLIILGHSRLISDTPLRVWLGLSEGSVSAISAWGGGIAGVLAMVTCFMLLARRFGIRRVREISITGNAMRFLTHYDITETQLYFRTLFGPGAIQVPHDPMFLLHFFMVQLLLIYLPFGKFLHIPGIFYSRTLLAKDY